MYNYFKIHALAKEKSFDGFSIFSSGGHLVQWRRIVRAILVESYPRNFPVKLFQNLSTILEEEVVLSFFFLFIALAAILFNEAEPFEQFW